ncbi:trehalase family glycosidase [soil metagenome]
MVTMAVTSALFAKAYELLRANDSGVFVKPSAGQYPHQWNWDAAFIAVGLRHADMALARREVRALLSGQWQDGLVPHILYHTGASDYFPTPDFWKVEGSPQAPRVPTSGLTQPPVLATAVRLMHEAATDKAESLGFVHEVYPKVLAWHRWLYSARDPEGSGLVAIIHPWESGTDNAARWAEPMARLEPVDVPPYRRRDKVHVRPDERPVESDYQRFMYLIGLFRDWRWEARTLYARSPFLIRDTLFNALLHRANEDLRALALELGKPVSELDGWLERARRAFAGLWEEEAGIYYDVDLRAEGPIRENSCACFIPLFAGLPDQAQRLVGQLRDPAAYAPGPEGGYYLPSAAKNSPLFEPRRYWRGPVWINVNWLVIQGLRRYGYSDLAATVRAQSLALMERGFAEYYDPRDGSPCGAAGFSWSAALAMDLLRE